VTEPDPAAVVLRRAAELWRDLDPRDPRPLAEQLDARLVVEEAERLVREEGGS